MERAEVGIKEVSSASQIASGFFHQSLAASPGTPPSLPAIPWPLKKLEEQLLISFRERLRETGGMNGGVNTPQLLAAGPLPERAAAPALAPSSPSQSQLFLLLPDFLRSLQVSSST